MINGKISQTQTYEEQTQTHEAKISQTLTYEEHNWLVKDRQWNWVVASGFSVFVGFWFGV